MRRLACLASALLLAACATAPGRAPTLYEQLGGRDGIAAITDRLLDAFAGDPLVAPAFRHVDIRRYRINFTDYLCQIADGPCHYTGDSMAEVHRGMHIDEAAFNAVVQDLITAMDRQHVPVRVQNRLLARLAPERKDIIYR
ncbi:MAG: group 1 truncated hemoglobin [Xanthomonadaceae bacterium]|nr:group 1 truncated hemoglobin [Xanthomonadaceae bacterium]MDE1964599.1 group 1 truncated hemoglobin [Xanthomonadaceae bacterium]